MMRILKAAILACAAAGAIALPALADDVYNACVNSKDPVYMGAEQEAACKCTTEAIGRKQALQDELISLTSMTLSEREGITSPELSKIISHCWPQQAQ